MTTRGKRILIIENDPDVGETTKMVLERLGNHKVILSNPRESSRKLEDQLPDMIILDSLPYTTNYFTELCTSIKLKRLPLMLFSTQPEVKRIAYKVGADDFLQKPFDVNKLLQKVAQLTGD